MNSKVSTLMQNVVRNRRVSIVESLDHQIPGTQLVNFKTKNSAKSVDQVQVKYPYSFRDLCVHTEMQIYMVD